MRSGSLVTSTGSFDCAPLSRRSAQQLCFLSFFAKSEFRCGNSAAKRDLPTIALIRFVLLLRRDGARAGHSRSRPKRGDCG